MKTAMACVFGVLLGLQASAWGNPDAQDLLRKAQDQVKAYKSPEGNPRKKETQAFAEACKALEALRDEGSGEAVDFLIKLADDRRGDMAMRGAAMRLLSTLGDKADAVKALQKAVQGGACSAQLVDALYRMKVPGGAEPFKKHLRHKSPFNQRSALRGLAYVGGLDDVLVKEIGLMLSKSKEQGQVWAICEALGGSRNAAAVPILIEAMGKPGGRPCEGRKALVRLTGVDHGGDPSAWSQWWVQNKATFKPVDALERAAKIGQQNNEGDNFYGLSTEGGRIVLLLDGSNSMKGSPFEKLKEEAAGMIETFTGDIEFAIVYFPYQSFPEHGYERGGSTGAKEFILNLNLKLGTPIYDAATKVSKNTMAGERSVADCIYLLTDGIPTDMPAEGELDAALLAMYPGDSVRIHTINLGGKPGQNMLETIAQEHGGQYIAPAHNGKGGKGKAGKK